MANKKTSQDGVDLIKSFEGLRLTAYKPVPTEVHWTIGYGRYSPSIKQGQTITKETAETWLKEDLAKYEAYVNDKNIVPITDSLNQNQFDALVSFCYNCGQGNLKTLCKGRSISQISDAMLLYNKSSGTILAGLSRRRKAERELLLKPVSVEVKKNMRKEDVDFILSIMSKYWGDMAGNTKIQNETHRVANLLRVDYGLPEQK